MKKFVSLILTFSLLMCVSCSSEEAEQSRESEETSAVEESEVVESIDETTVDVPSGFDPDFTFTTTDRSGVTYDETVFAQNKLTMINFWEPWCGPCVQEMPELEELYENYADQGFLIIGVYATEGVESDVDEVLESTGVTYPILTYTSEFDQFQSGFVPTSILVDSEGHIIEVEGDTMIVGANDYAGWEELVTSHLG